MKTLHILLKDRQHELQTEVSDDFSLEFPAGIAPTTNGAFANKKLFVNLSEVVAMWVTKEED